MKTGKVAPAPKLSASLHLEQAQQVLRKQLAGVSDSPASDVRALLANIVGRSTSWVLAHPEHVLTADQRRRLIQATGQLLSGVPLPYVLGEWPFFGLKFYVSPDALIPRPETELLVEEALGWLKSNPSRRLVLDVGTGTGCIAVALAVNHPGLQVLASDVSRSALRLARKNGIRHRVENRIYWMQGDLVGWVRGGIDLICANLPYIPADRLPGLDVYKREPSRALDGGPDGMSLIRRLLQDAGRLLSPGGALLAEIDASQADKALAEARLSLPGSGAAVIPDLAGRDRLLQVKLPGQKNASQFQ